MPPDGIPPLPPRTPYRLSEMDRRFLRSLRIAQDEEKERPDALPYQSNPHRDPSPPKRASSQADGCADDDDGA